jgi:hypothetical protein
VSLVVPSNVVTGDPTVTERVGWSFTMAAAAYNLIRLVKLMGAA